MKLLEGKLYESQRFFLVLVHRSARLGRDWEWQLPETVFMYVGILPGDNPPTILIRDTLYYLHHEVSENPKMFLKRVGKP